MTIDDRTTIWNRAAMSAGGATPGLGDQASSAALRFHGMVMSGGIDDDFGAEFDDAHTQFIPSNGRLAELFTIN
jgi:hypothetical protein